MKIKVTDFSSGIREDKSDSLKNIGVAKKLLNFDAKNGALRGIKNISKFVFNTNGVDLTSGRVFFYKRFDNTTKKRDDKLIFFDKDLNSYYMDVDSNDRELKPLGVKFGGEPRAQNYRLDGEDVVILVSSEDNMVVWDGVKSPEIVLDAPKIGSMDIHYERLFAVVSGGDGAELKFSDDLDPTNWSESLSDAGTIELVDDRGRLLKVVSFNDYLYIFREYGITRLYANTAIQTSFYINHLFTSGGRILENTIALAGDHVFFMSTDGFYVFDGASTKRVLENIFPLIEFTGDERATYFNGNYYLSCKLKGDETGNVLIEICRDDMTSKIISGLNPSSMVLFAGENGAQLIIVDGKTGEVYFLSEKESIENSISLHSVYESPKLTFGYGTKRKVVRGVELFLVNPNNSEIKLTIVNEEDEKVEILSSKNSVVSNLFFSGFEFRVMIEADDNLLEVLELSLTVKEA